MTREFTATPAKLDKVPLFVGLVGASSSGKTYSALRLATGMKKVHGGPIVFIDTENRRALHYANLFDFEHMHFDPPFGSLDYLAAIEAAQKLNPSCIIIDSMSHEHDGPGGLLETHDAELDRMAGADAPQWKRDAMGFSAWKTPKADRRKLLTALTRTETNVIACFRGQEKTKMVKNEKGKNAPTVIGWQAITDQQFVFEMALCCLLMPGSKGVPTFESDMPAERAAMKIPQQFQGLLKPGQPLTEDIGEKLAIWAKGGAGSGEADQALIDEGAEAAERGMAILGIFWKRISNQDRIALQAIKDKTWKPRALEVDAAHKAAAESDEPFTEPEEDELKF